MAESRRPPPGATLRRRDAAHLATLVLALTAANVVNNRLALGGQPATRPAEVLLLLGFARSAGLGWAELGLARGTRLRGLRWACVAIALTAAAYATAMVWPALRPALLDERAHFGVGRALYEAAVPVLAGTVLLEELAFRGVLWGLLCRWRGPTAATAVSSVLFGLWHVLPARSLPGDNQAVGDVLGTGAAAGTTAVVLGVVLSALAGAFLCELRRRSGSLLAPIGLHWATNGLGYIFSSVSWALH